MQPNLVGAIAQLVEQWTENPCVPSSNLGSTTSKKPPDNSGGFLVYISILTNILLIYDTDHILLMFDLIKIHNYGRNKQSER